MTFLLPTAETFARDLPTKWKIKFWADGQLGAPKVNMWRPGALWAPMVHPGAPRCSQVGPGRSQVLPGRFEPWVLPEG